MSELKIREDLSLVYHLVDYFDWTQLIFNHISARMEDNKDEFLINPLGLLYDEIRPTNLIKMNVKGEVLDKTKYQPNKAGFVIHSAIYKARPDVSCIIHTHSNYGVAVSNLEEGLMFLNQSAMALCDKVAYHEFHGIEDDVGEQNKLIESMGDNSCLILRNHGLLVAESSIEKAFMVYSRLEAACKMQMLTLAGGRKINLVPESTKKFVTEQFKKIEKSGIGMMEAESSSTLLFNAMRRMIDKIGKYK